MNATNCGISILISVIIVALYYHHSIFNTTIKVSYLICGTQPSIFLHKSIDNLTSPMRNRKIAEPQFVGGHPRKHVLGRPKLDSRTP